MIVEFPSVVEAVRCAVSVQREMEAREADNPEERRILYRIGVNLGDVIIQNDDVYGDGVNIAARLEGLAPPGGVIVSGTAYDHLKTNIDVGYVDLGEQQMKNIATPIRAYQVVPEGHAELTQPTLKAQRLMPLATIVGVLATVAVLAGLAVWQFVLAPPSIDTPLAEDAPILAMPAGPKIVVLPFENLSGDPEQDFFVDGLTEDLTARLADHKYLFVIGRNTAFQYKERSPNIQDVGRALGVNYVVGGSIRRSADRIRVVAQVHDAQDGAQIWGNTFDKDLSVEDIFSIQDALAIAISEAVGGTKGAISQSVSAEVSVSNIKDIAELECFLLGWVYWNTYDPATHAKARDCAESIVGRDPNNDDAWATLAGLYRAEYENGANPRPDARERAADAATLAVKLDPSEPLSHLQRAQVMRGVRWDEARSSLDQAIRLVPRNPATLHVVALVSANVGRWEQAIAIWNKVIELDPSPPTWSYWTPIAYYLNAGRLEEAYRYTLILKQQQGDIFFWVPATEALLLAEIGRMGEAKEALARAAALNLDLATTARESIVGTWFDQHYIEVIMNGLYKAGLERKQVEKQ